MDLCVDTSELILDHPATKATISAVISIKQWGGTPG